jgi:tetratricopeptide (TPR) repeat protein/transglutaminase-like putative cysteine protease
MLAEKRLPLLLLAAACSFVSAQVSPPAKPSLYAPDFSKEAYVIEELSTRITAEQDGTGTKETSAKVKIISDAGVKAFAVLSFTYTSANEVVEIDYVRVRKPDGTVVKTPDYNVQDMPAEVTRTAPLYSDIHEKHVAVKGLGVGDVLEYSMRHRIVKPEVPGQFWAEYTFSKDAIAKDVRLEISFPAGKSVKIVSPEFKPEISEEAGRRIYRWKHSNLIVKQQDPNEIPRRIPPNPDVQVTTFSSWEEVGKWYGDLQKPSLEVTPAIQAKAAELTKGLNTDEEKIHAIYNFVALKYHYIGLDFGIGRYQPHAADDVLDNGYGDCKDKHTLLATLLKAVGIEVWPVLIHAQRKLDPDVPSPAQFNHVITVVPLGGSFVWLDTTPEVAPYGLLLLALRDKQALMIPSNKTVALVTTPANAPFAQEQKFTTEGKLANNGTFKGHIVQAYRGDTEVLMRLAFRQVAESKWNELVQQISYRLNFGGDVSDVKTTSLEDLDKPFEISYNYERKNYGGWEDRQIVAPLPPMGFEVPGGAPEKKLVEPMSLGAVGKTIYHARVELPSGYEATTPSSCHESHSFIEYTGETHIENGVMSTDRVLTIKKPKVALTEWDEFRKFGKALSDDEFNYVHLTAIGAGAGSAPEPTNPDEMFRQATSALEGRDLKRAEELLDKLLVKQPDYKGAHLGLAYAMAGQNRMPEALVELEKEEKVSPTDTRAYLAAARMATFQGKKDYAAEQWRRLLKADPKNRTAAESVAAYLVEQQKYPDAIEVLETSAKNAPDSSSLQFQLGETYIKAGQTAKGIAHLHEAADAHSTDAMMLNNVAYTLAEAKTDLSGAQKYGEASLSELDDEARGAESSNSAGMRVTYDYGLVWDTLGWVYFQQGDNARAEQYARAAWQLQEEELVGDHLGQIYEKEGKTQQAARAYESALAVASMPSSPALGGPSVTRKQEQEIQNRYKRLTGKDPSLTETHRLPNGEWSLTPAERLRRSREIKLNNDGKLDGKAEFIVSINPQEVESADFDAGDEELRSLESKLEKAHYPYEFPPDSDATLVVRILMRCHSDSDCIGTPMPPTQVTTPRSFTTPQ